MLAASVHEKSTNTAVLRAAMHLLERAEQAPVSRR
jgi:hypothetical protein